METPAVQAAQYPQLILGLALCVFGWVLYWIGLHAAGVALGGAVGGLAGLGLSVVIGQSHQWGVILVVVGAIAGGGVGFFLIRKVHALAFFVIGAVAGALGAILTWDSVLAMAGSQAGSAMAKGVYLALWAGMMGALLAIYHRYVTIIVTSLLGTVLIVVSLGGQPKGAVWFLLIFPASLLAQAIQFRHFSGKAAGPGKAGSPPGGRA